LIVRAFCDSAVVYQSDKLPFENNSTLMSVGVGTEVQLWRNFNGRVDWGFPVRDDKSNGRTVEAWDGRVSFIVTVIF
jgi:hemolysin activation/secretion protein